MRAWMHAIAVVGALLFSGGVAVADAPSGGVLANQGVLLSVDADEPASTPPAAAGSRHETMTASDLRELVQQLTDGRGPAGTSASPATSTTDTATSATTAGQPLGSPDASSGTASEPISPTASRESEALGPRDVASDNRSTGNNLFTGTGSMVLNTLTALGLVIGLILLLRWGWTKLSGQPSASTNSVVEVLARTPVAPRNHILLVRVGSRVLIVGDSSAGLRTLATVDDPDEIADLLTAVTAAQESSISRGFNQLLSRFQGDYDAEADPLTPRFDDEGGDRSEHVFDRARDSMSGLMARLRTMSGKGGGG